MLNRKVALIDGVLLGFGQGRFDNWCIYVLGKNLPKYPKDEWYFSIVREWTRYRDEERIYSDFCSIYDKTTKEVDKDVLTTIESISKDYQNPYQVQTIFTILYMGMIAEENKEGSILGKRIKRLGVHQVLKDKLPPSQAANFSRGKSVITLTMECHSRGF